MPPNKRTENLASSDDLSHTTHTRPDRRLLNRWDIHTLNFVPAAVVTFEDLILADWLAVAGGAVSGDSSPSTPGVSRQGVTLGSAAKAGFAGGLEPVVRFTRSLRFLVLLFEAMW